MGTRHVAYWHVLPAPLVTCHPGLPSAGQLWSCQVRGAHPSHLVTFFPVLLSTSLSPQRNTQNQARGQAVVPGSHWLFPGAGCQPGVSGVCRCAFLEAHHISLQPGPPLPALSVFPVPPRGRPRWCLLGPLQTSSVLSLCKGFGKHTSVKCPLRRLKAPCTLQEAVPAARVSPRPPLCPGQSPFTSTEPTAFQNPAPPCPSSLFSIPLSSFCD